ncbi:hypothetical protein [Pseudodesulfovibrio tunisiensis]|uniref:hypothetical protein n=1 Tax=Pseudodesulfovibrio tunisiensis TaxID=463192 RepID=UPI001FB32F97|nr:hypothetical protein [Pseudodesulfovibrio tunisiensis]
MMSPCVPAVPVQADTRADRYPDPVSIEHVPPIMRQDISRFYHRLSRTGRRVIGALLESLPNLDAPAALVVSALAGPAKCSRLSVLRHLARGEAEQLFSRSVNPAGRRHGMIVTPHRHRCETFLHLFRTEYGLLADTNGDHYQAAPDTNGDQYPHPVRERAVSADRATASGRFLATLSPAARRVLGVLVLEGEGQDEISMIVSRMAYKAGCSEITARRTLSRGSETGLFSKLTHPRGPRHGVLVRVPAASWMAIRSAADTNADRYPSGHDTKPDWYHDQVDTDQDTNHDRYPDTNGDRYPQDRGNRCRPTVTGENSGQRDTNGDRYQPASLLDRQKEDLSVWERRLLGLTRDDFQAVWPNLLSHGFGPDQIRQIVNARSEAGEPLEDIQGSLHSAEWELAGNKFPSTRKGVASYLFSTLKLNGTYRRLDAYVSPEKLALMRARADLEASRQAREIRTRLERAEQKPEAQDAPGYAEWLAAQSPEDLERIDGQACVLPTSDTARNLWRRSYWRKNVASPEAGEGE